MAKFTPGPWEVSPGYRQPWVRQEGHHGKHIPIVSPWVEDAFGSDSDPRREETIANMHLIAAAPELYEVCEEMLNALEGSTAQVMATAGRMKAILAKAKGKTS